MGPKAINWSSITELPPIDHLLFTGDNPVFQAILLPKTDHIRRIKVTCLRCKGPNIYSAIRTQYNYIQTSNYWTHLRGQHKAIYKDLKGPIPSDEESSSQASSSIIQPKSQFFYRNPNANIIPTDVKRLIIKFIIANNLSFKSVISPEFKELINTLNPEISIPAERTILNEVDNFYTEQLSNLSAKIALYKEKGSAFNLCLDSWTSLNQKAYLGISIHWLNDNWDIESYLLRLYPLYKRHSGKYLYKVLIETLKDFNIDQNILTITYDNASNNNILISRFFKYNKETIPKGYFINNIRCLAHIINLIVQDIISEIKGDITQEELINISQISEDLTEDTDILLTLDIVPVSRTITSRPTKRLRQNTEGEDIPIDPAILTSLPTVPQPSLITSKPINQETIKDLKALEASLTSKSILNKIRLQISKLRNQQKLIQSLKRSITADESIITNISRPILDVPTRWNSTFNMLETYMLIKPAIDHTISKHPDDFTNIILDNNEIILVKELINVLKPFLYASKELQRQKEPIFIYSHLIITKLHQHIKDLIRNTEYTTIKKGLEKGLAKLEKYFPQDYSANAYDIYAFSIILDPRFKADFLQKKLGYSAINLQFIKQRFRQLFDSYSLRYKDLHLSDSQTSISENIEPQKPKSYKEQLLDQFTQDLSDDEDSIAFNTTELDLYLAEPRASKDINVKDYWKLKEKEYRVLATLAKDFLSIMATSAPIEREFSKLADIANNKKRNRLSAKRVNQLICLKSWANIDIKEEDSNTEESEED
jgi:hypothetical protein